MAAGLPDLVDCARLAEDAAVLRREFALSELPRVQDLLAESAGTVRASFAFAKSATGRAGAGKAPLLESAAVTEASGEMRRPFSALQDLLKRT
jgi:hypothetical protein